MAQITAAYRESALRRGIIVKSSKSVETSAQLLYAASVELINLGFIVKPAELEGFSTAELEKLISVARKVIGADRKLKPIYPGFPQQVEELDTLTLIIEQLLHYWTAGSFLPDYPEIPREALPLVDMVRQARELRVLSAAATARELTRQLATSPVALSDDDKTLLNGSLELQHPSLVEITEIARNARHGENLQSFIAGAAAVTDHSPAALIGAVAPYTDNTDQLLRVVLTLASAPADEKWKSNYELAVETLADRNARAVRMGKLPRVARRAIVQRVGDLTAGFKADSLLARQELWRGVFRTVHPFEFKLTDAQRRAVDIVHSNIEYRTLNSLVEEAMAKGKVKKAVKLLAKNQPGNLLRRVVALLRLVKGNDDARVLADAIRATAGRSSVSTLISAYNGILSANDDAARVTRVAGLNNTMVNRSNVVKVKKSHIKLVLSGVEAALVDALKLKDAPAGPVAIKGDRPVPLVRRDASTADRVVDRGEEIAVANEGDTLRIFGHFVNNQSHAGYMDIGVVILNDKFEHLGISTWDTWSGARDWSTYSGDCLVSPGNDAAEFIDVKLPQLRKRFPKAKWAAMTVQSYSGWPIEDVDFIAGAMFRSDAKKGEVFDARSVVSAFKPTTRSTQAVPFAVNLETGRLVWIDSSNGSTASGISSSRDSTIGSIVYDEIARERLSLGKLAKLWAKAHGVKTVDKPVAREELLALLG